MAERVRVQERSGRRIRPQKYPRGKSSFNLIHVCPQVRIRVTHTVTETLNSHTLRSMQYWQFRPIGFQLTDQFVFNLTLIVCSHCSARMARLSSRLISASS